MRVEPHGVGSIVHVTKRGTRGSDIVRDSHDRTSFVQSIFYLNDAYSAPNLRREVAECNAFERPRHWPKHEPLVHILAWTLLSNHFHLLLQEVREGGTAKFMQRLGGSMSAGFNAKYGERGSLFQGGYHGRVITEESHINYLAFYILIKNVLDMYPGGLRAAQDNFDDAWEWAKQYQYSSFRNIVSGASSLIVDDEEGLVVGIIGAGNAYKQEARELLHFHMASHGEEFKDLMLEPW